MTREFDEITLSIYMDGELDEMTMDEVETFIDKSTDAKSHILQFVKTQARLKASLNKSLHEEVPKKMKQLLSNDNATPIRQSVFSTPLIQIAAAVVLMFFGFGAGSFFMGQKSLDSSFQYPFSKNFDEVIAETLEQNLSGISSQFDQVNKNEHVIVTPVKTYRGADKKYYRQFQLQYVKNSDKSELSVRGLAYRSGPNQWKTTAFFFNP